MYTEIALGDFIEIFFFLYLKINIRYYNTILTGMELQRQPYFWQMYLCIFQKQVCKFENSTSLKNTGKKDIAKSGRRMKKQGTATPQAGLSGRAPQVSKLLPKA